MDNEIETKEVATNGSVSDQVEQMYQDVYDWQNWGITSFTDLANVDHSGDAIEDLSALHSVAQVLLFNIQDVSPDKIGAARSVVQDYYDLANAVLDEYDTSTDSTKEKKPGMFEKAKTIVAEFVKACKPKKGSNKKGNMPGDKMMADEDMMDHKKPAKRKGLTIWKDAETGKYRWFADYSNNFRDDDNPSEIISKESHERFEQLVDNGTVDYPELWHWHTPGTAWGKADFVTYDTETGIAMASGYVYEGHEKEAEWLMETDEEIGVSHGMPKGSVKYDPNDPTVIVEHITKEISDLPLWAAANKLTSFIVFKENEMQIPEKKKTFLESLLGKEKVAEIDAENQRISKEAKEAGIQYKEQAPAETTPETPAVEQTETGTAASEPETPVTETKEQTVVKVEITPELTEAITNINSALEAITKEITSLRSEVDGIKSKEATPSDVPAASVAAMIARNLSVTANHTKEALVRKNNNLNDAGPVETPAEEKPVIETGNFVMDEVISRIVGK